MVDLPVTSEVGFGPFLDTLLVDSGEAKVLTHSGCFASRRVVKRSRTVTIRETVQREVTSRKQGPFRAQSTFCDAGGFPAKRNIDLHIR